jgi:hypothetical protein
VRKVCDSTITDNGYWRIKTYQEINYILKGQNRIGFIKKQRLNWLGHVKRITEDNIVQMEDGNPCPYVHPEYLNALRI